MPEVLFAADDGEPIDLDATEAAFAAAMAAPPADRPGMAAPARKPPKPADDPDAAPYGWTFTDGEWRPKKTAGRPTAAADKARVTAKAPPVVHSPESRPGAGKPKTEKPRDYTKSVKEVAEAVWFVAATVPVPDQALGYKLTGLRTKLRVQAAIVESNVDGIAGGLNLIGQHNKFVGNALSRMASGEGGLWVLPACMMLAPFAAQTAQLWTAGLDGVDLDQVAEHTEAQAAAYVQKLAEAATAQG